MAANGSARKRAQQHKQEKEQTQQQRLWIGGAAALLVIAIGAGLFLMGNSSGDGGVNFQGATLEGETLQLSDYRGDVVLINFWATWCPPCRAEMPAIQAAYDLYDDQGFTVLAINAGETQSQVRPFVDAFDMSFPVVMDNTSRLTQQFGIRSFPTSLFVGRDGEIYATHTGLLQPDDITAYIEQGL